MKLTSIVKLAAATLPAFALGLHPVIADAATTVYAGATPAADGKPYNQDASTTGLDFSNWTFVGSTVRNSASITRFWSVPLTVPYSADTSLVANQLSLVARCTAGGSQVFMRVYNFAGSTAQIGPATNCAGVNVGVSLQSGSNVPMSAHQTAVVTFSLQPSAVANNVILFTGNGP